MFYFWLCFAVLLCLMLIAMVRGSMFWASLLLFVPLMLLPLLSFLMLKLTMPSNVLDVAHASAHIPLAVGGVAVLCLLLVLYARKKAPLQPSGQNSLLAVVVSFLACTLMWFGFIAFLFFIFASYTGRPQPLDAVVSFSTTVVAAVIAWFVASCFEGQRYINIFRWCAYWGANVMVWVVFTFTMVFFYSYPGDEAQPWWGAVLCLNYVPLAFLLVGLNQGYVRLPRVKPALPD